MRFWTDLDGICFGNQGGFWIALDEMRWFVKFGWIWWQFFPNETFRGAKNQGPDQGASNHESLTHLTNRFVTNSKSIRGQNLWWQKNDNKTTNNERRLPSNTLKTCKNDRIRMLKKWWRDREFRMAWRRYRQICVKTSDFGKDHDRCKIYRFAKIGPRIANRFANRYSDSRFANRPTSVSIGPSNAKFSH